MESAESRSVYSPPNDNPFLTVLNYSGGVQSHALARMVLLGMLKMPERFLVVAADPGAENPLTYKFRDRTFNEFRERGIDAIIAEGPKMVEDLAKVKKGEATRFDNPPLYTINEKGKVGQLMQKCTAYYKLRPMDRVIRRHLREKYGVRGVKPNSVERWIGFCWDERRRVKPPKVKYQQFRYPLIDLKMTKSDVLEWYRENNEPVPPRSVCEFCFANGLDFYKKQHAERPDSFNLAKKFDNDIRDLSQAGVKDTAYCSRSMIPLEELERRGFSVDAPSGNDDDLSCDSGVCFI